VFKAIIGSINPVSDAIRYARKVMPEGKIELRSIINIDPAERFIAPPDLIARMSKGVPIRFSHTLEQHLNFLERRELERDSIISTMPMMTLMHVLKYDGPQPDFRWLNGGTMKFIIDDCDLFATLYFPFEEDIFYRISITGNQVIGESVNPSLFMEVPEPHSLLKHFGLEKVRHSHVAYKPQAYAKINNLSEEDRAKADRFMMWASVEHGIYSLGRFATWRAGLLLDDLVKDVNRIEGWITQGSYKMRKEMQS
jgi:hypothetical protein